MKLVTLRTTVAAIAITSAASAWAQSDLNADANADASADVETSTTVDNALENSGDAIESTADALGDAIEDTSQAIADGAEDAYEATEDTAEAATEDTNAEADANVTAETDTEVTETDSTATADAQSEQVAPDAEMVDGFSGMTVADIVGQSVVEANGRTVGDVDHVIRNGDEIAVVIGMGGFLGIGQHDVAVPLSQVTQGADGTLQLSDTTEEELNLMPEVDLDAATELSADQSI
ncbi:PRC-barrel domain protein [Sulfitobacter sp. THAF37]|uniref:PRC-barrel domain-containing protein n=1 Tax=Sulfitobacter sp. THAF37 TaxID=2587855 RepID=UPI001268911F|nr:PRC-barrel domain-containing protein [Sulfitobacter sp. THAF37]QFT58294.1 PRC-barrel domain protein [Sulfitobacter sp. THAF37]